MNRSYDPRPRPPTRLAFHVSRIVIDAGVLLVLGAMSLPFVTAEGFQQRALAGDGLLALLLLLPVFVFTLIPDHSTPLPLPLSWAALLLAAAALPYGVVKYLDASTLAGTVQGSVGMGSRVLVIGALAALGGVLIGLVRSLLHLPDAGDRPDAAPPPEAAPASSRVPAAGQAMAASSAKETRPFPRRRRPGRTREETPAGSEPPTVLVPGRPPARGAPRPSPTDPDTAPTVPAQRPVQPWWPDDLDDLFS